MYGGLIVHEPSTHDTVDHGYDKELLLLAGDWYHHTSAEVLGRFMNAASDGNEVSIWILISGDLNARNFPRD